MSMRPLRRDHHVRFLSEESIAHAALNCRRLGGYYNDGYFNITDLVENVLRTKARNGPLRIVFFDAADDDEPAYVTFDPLTLRVDHEIWELARSGEPDARFIIAHEIGHLVLHDHDAKAFSTSPEDQIKFAPKGNSAEWQANAFAAHLLLPSHIVAIIDDLQGLVACGVNKNLAQERLSAERRAKCATTYNGDACPRCGNFTVVRIGNWIKCDTCGKKNWGFPWSAQ